MSAAQALEAARSAGVKVGIDGDALTLEAATTPSSTSLEAQDDVWAPRSNNAESGRSSRR
jgi:hypothetical protein